MKKQPSKTIQVGYPSGVALQHQFDFHSDKTSSVKGLEGGYASAKSYTLVMDTLINTLSYPGNICVYGRLTIDEINRTFFPILDDICPSELIISHNKQERLLKFVTGEAPSMLYYIPLDDSKGAKDKIKSMNIGYVAIDQMEEVTEDIFWAFRGRLRNRKGRRQLAFNCNPEGHDWVWRLFYKEINKYHKWKLYTANAWREDAPVPERSFINERAVELGKDATDLIIKDFPELVQYTDNPYLPIDYLMDMLSWPDNIKRRYVYGKRDAFEGLIYNEFDEKIHVIEPFDTLNNKFIRVIAMDYGKTNPSAILFLDIDKTGNIYVTDEIYGSNYDVPTLKLMIQAKNKQKKVDAWIADGSIWDTREENQISVGDLFRTLDDASGFSITWSRADRSSGAVNAGIDMVAQYLKHDKFTESHAKLYFFRGKVNNTLEEIQDYRWKEMAQSQMMKNSKNRPETPRKYNDHAMDAMRYGVSWIKRYDLRLKDDESRARRIVRMIEKTMRQGNKRGWMTA